MYKLPDDLFEFQKEDVNRLLESDDNFLNLSEMGTGKTPVALGLATLGGFKKTLIVCPKTLQLEWARQIGEWVGIDPSVARRGCYRRLETLFDDILKGKNSNPFFIVNYETFRTPRHREVLNAYPFDLIILDEGHRIRNPKTKQTKGMFEFILENHPKVPRVILTGSPIVNNPADLFTLLCLVRPDEYHLRYRMEFIDKHCYYWRSRYGVHVTGVRDMERLREETAPFTIRHTKSEVLPFFPEKYFKKVLLQMNKDQRDTYDQMESELFILLDSGEPLYAASVLAELMRLRQLNLEPRLLDIEVSSSKTDFLMELLEDLPEDRKVVIFSCFESYISALSRLVDLPHVVITGKIPMVERAEAVKQFQNDPETRVALGTVQSMGEGITLTAASDVVLMDRWWNPAVNNQAIDRLHRIGQKNAVQVIEPINERSIDQSLDTILERKAKISMAYLGDQDVISETIMDMRRDRDNQ